MAKKNQRSTEAFKDIQPKEHGGACPTCGHCKCCEQKAAPIINVPPICTRRHYPDWTYRPYESPVWYGTSTSTAPAVTITGLANTGDN